jgi:hypothetical protein
MSLDSYPDAASGQVVNQDESETGFDGDIRYLTLTKNLELRVKSDESLRNSIEALILEVRELKDLLRMLAG